jgi:hypothetical protein
VFFLRDPIALPMSAAVGDFLSESIVLSLEEDVLL